MRRIVSRLLLAALLFAQGAIATYACPAWASKLAPPAAATASAPIPDCHSGDKVAAMDVDTPNLCLAHCQTGLQINDQSDAPNVLPIVASILTVVLPDPAASASAGRAFATESIFAAASPPHAILHCCFRI